MDSQAMEMNEKANGSAPDQARGFDPLPFLSRLLRRRASRQEVDPPPSPATTPPDLEDADAIIDRAASTPAEEEEIEPEDPACVAAGLLIDHALRAAGTTLADASRDGAVSLVVVPAEPWISHAAERWKIEARHGVRPREGSRELHWTDRGTYSRRSDWMCWKAEAPGETGASECDESDLAAATELATAAATTMGLDEESGLIWRGVPDMAVLPEMLRTDPALAARVRSVIAAAYADALGLARRRASAVKALAAELLRCQVIDGAAAASIVQQHSGSQAGLSERAASVCGSSEMPR